MEKSSGKANPATRLFPISDNDFPNTPDGYEDTLLQRKLTKAQSKRLENFKRLNCTLPDTVNCHSSSSNQNIEVESSMSIESSLTSSSLPLRAGGKKRRFSSDPTSIYSEKPNLQQKKIATSKNNIQNLGPPKYECQHCHVMLWYEERAEKYKNLRNPSFSLCCRKGKVNFPLLKEPPQFLRDLLSPHGGSRASKFKENIRAYNSMFAFTSSGGVIDNTYNNGRGPYCFRLHGQNHHRIGSLLPVPGKQPQFCQLYIYDTDNEIENRMGVVGNGIDLDPAIVEGLLHMLDQYNILVKSFRMVRERLETDGILEFHLVIKASRSGDGRTQNMPSATEIAGLIVGDLEDTIGVRDIVVDDRKLGLSRISDLHPSFMAMQYPLLFPYGEDGFRLGVDLIYPSNVSENKRKEVTMMQYAAFRIQQRRMEGNTLLLSGKLFQTYIVDLLTCIEEDRLHWIRKNQTKI